MDSFSISKHFGIKNWSSYFQYELMDTLDTDRSCKLSLFFLSIELSFFFFSFVFFNHERVGSLLTRTILYCFSTHLWSKQYSSEIYFHFSWIITVGNRRIFFLCNFFYFDRKGVPLARNQKNIHYLTWVVLSGIHWKSFESYQLRYLETIFFWIISSFEVDSYSISVFFLDSSTNRRITKKKWGIDSWARGLVIELMVDRKRLDRRDSSKGVGSLTSQIHRWKNGTKKSISSASISYIYSLFSLVDLPLI